MMQKRFFRIKIYDERACKRFHSLWAFEPLKRRTVYCSEVSVLDHPVTQYYITEELILQLDRCADIKTRTATNCSLTNKKMPLSRRIQ
jgi:hypothetical protein